MDDSEAHVMRLTGSSEVFLANGNPLDHENIAK